MPPVKKEHLIMSDVVCRSLQYTYRLNYGVSHDLDDLALVVGVRAGCSLLAWWFECIIEV